MTQPKPHPISLGYLLALSIVPCPLIVPPASAANYAAAVSQFNPGAGAAVGYDQPSSVLGEPSRVTPGDFGGPVDPFSGPWQSSQLLSLGVGGSLTVRFAQPIHDVAANPYGLDFIIFGSAAFMITNGDFSGGGVTDGSLFGNAAGPTRVSVSADGTTFYTLDPAHSPTVDGLFPTDGAGDFARPVDPKLAAADFAGLGLAGIRALYQGSGGGMGYDLAWARDGAGQAVALDHVEFVRIDVLGDRVEIDGFSAVPEPSARLLLPLGLAAVTVARRPRHRSPR